ncbi:hypothetical protein LT493_00940 [Streptomyces tricolor]|nr:hypothetical protein [Streptomyces tricolor]
MFAFLHRRLAELPHADRQAPAGRGGPRTDGWAATVVDVSRAGARGTPATSCAGTVPRLPSAAVRRVVREAAGKPAGAAELPVHRTGDPLDGTAPWPAAAEPGHRL